MSEWDEVAFSDLLVGGVRNGVYKSKEFHGRGARVVNMKELFAFERIDLQPELRVELTPAELEKFALEPGDLLFARRSFVLEGAGKCSIIGSVNDDLVFESSMIRARVDPTRADARFLYFFFRSPTGRALISTIATRTAVSGITGKNLSHLPVPIPPIWKQCRIADQLQLLDDLIENNRRRVEVLEEMARAIYREWFVHFRYPGHEHVTFVDSPLGSVPEGWQVGTVNQLVSLIKATVDPTSIDPETPAVGLEHIPRRQITLDEWARAEGLASRKGVFERGDVLFGKIRPYFHKVSVAPLSGICSTDAIVLRADGEHWGQAVMTLSSDEFVALATQTANGTKMPRADWKVLQQFPVPIPTVDLSTRFTDMVSELLGESQVLMLQNRQLATLRDLLLPKLVSGQIDVSSLDLDALVEGAGGLMPAAYGEDGLVEQPALELLGDLGWSTASAWAETFGAAGTLGRDSAREVVLVHRLRAALSALNPDLPAAVLAEAEEAMVRDRSVMDRVRANREVHDLLREGYRAQWLDEAGEQQYARVRYVDFDEPAANDWLAASQVWFAGELYRRRTDVVLFVNGIPLVLAEFKQPNRPAKAAFEENVTDYRDAIPALFVPNGFVICSNGSEAKVGSTYAPWEFFGDWKVIDADGNRGVVALETAIRGTCAPERLLDLIENFVAYLDRPGGLIKVVARNHQFLGVNAAIDNLHRVRDAGEKRLGVFWHTQGSGKSLSMLWFTQKVLRSIPGGWTFVMVTDRTELDVQLHGEFAAAGAISAEANVHAGSASHLRELLAADHRYVFTLIHKFRLDQAAGETTMPVLSDRSDVIVITDEAHRSQYDTLALNMRQALPNAAMMGFTGTPLMEGEELTRQQFGDYVSTYNFRDAIEDGATVPLYYENRIPELQLTNENFADDLAELLEDAELDEDAEGQLTRRFGREYTLLTRPERLRTVARDLVEHFVGRGFTGKAMYVGIDKAAAVRMHDYVQEAWAEHLAELRTQHDALPVLERPWLASRIELMESTDMAVVVSQAQNELATLDRHGLDIRPHRARMNTEDLAEKFKAPADPLRLVFVCAMWMTGFDAPSVSSIYLDRPMRNHTLMQTIARANRVFPEKDNGIIVDYIGVFRNLEKALAIYGAANADVDVDTPIQDIDALVDALNDSIHTVTGLCSTNGVDLIALRDATGFAHIALRDAAVEALLVDEDTRTGFLAAARQTRKLFKALLPDPAAAASQHTVAAIRALAERIADISRPAQADLDEVADAVDALLDRSVGAEEYVIRAAAEGSEPDPLIDLSRIDFDALAASFAGRKRAETDRLASLLKQRAVASAAQNPTRHDLVERIEELIADYNAGSLNIDEYLRRLISLSQTLSEEEQRAVAEGLTEAELAIFDLLTQPEPELTDLERDTVKDSAKRLLEHIQDQLVLDWRRKAATTASVRTTILDVLDADLPADPYPPEIFEAKVQAVFDHIATVYGDDGTSVYQDHPLEVTPTGAAVTAPATGSVTTANLTAEVVEQLRHDAEFVSLIANKLGLTGHPELRSIDELIDNDEDYAVEFKSTARWDLRRDKPNKEIEDAIVKTVAGFLNTDGGTLLIGIGPDREVVGLEHDYAKVKPNNGDGFVNWLTTHLINALGYTPVTRVRARIATYGGAEICRVDVAASPAPVRAKTSKVDIAFFVRFNNSTRVVPEVEIEDYVGSRWPDRAVPTTSPR